MNSYCQLALDAKADNLHKIYHDTAYGFPIEDDNELFGRLLLEINQAGLSWDLMLKKQDNFRAAYAGFGIAKVAAFTEDDRAVLLSNAGIIRNKLKVNAAIHNANEILKIQAESGSFKNWLDENHPKTKEEWVKTFKKRFKFVGGEIVGEFLMSTGYLKGAHSEDCPIFVETLKNNPAWTRQF